MAFGSFFKKIISGVKTIAPIVRKGLDVVSKVAPTIGNVIGGPIGGIINTVGAVAGKAGQFMDKHDVVGKIGRFDVPLLK